jgi:hypothetical protein
LLIRNYFLNLNIYTLLGVAATIFPASSGRSQQIEEFHAGNDMSVSAKLDDYGLVKSSLIRFDLPESFFENTQQQIRIDLGQLLISKQHSTRMTFKSTSGSIKLLGVLPGCPCMQLVLPTADEPQLNSHLSIDLHLTGINEEQELHKERVALFGLVDERGEISAKTEVVILCSAAFRSSLSFGRSKLLLRKEEAASEIDKYVWSVPATLAPGFAGHNLTAVLEIDGYTESLVYPKDVVTRLLQENKLTVSIPKDRFFQGSAGVARFYGCMENGEKLLLCEISIVLEDRGSVQLLPRKLSVRLYEDIRLRLLLPTAFDADNLKVKVSVNGKEINDSLYSCTFSRPRVATLTIRPLEELLSPGANECMVDLIHSVDEVDCVESLRCSIDVLGESP